MKTMKKKMNVKLIVATLSFLLLFGGTLGSSLAWLLDSTDAVTNTFTNSDIGVNLEEPKGEEEEYEFKMVPGWTITKDPKAWIDEGSEDCFLFVKVEKSANFDQFMTCAIAEGWNKLTTPVGTNYEVYYRKVTSADMGEDHKFQILKNDQVVVKETVTKGDMTQGFTSPTLKFTAYAHQLYRSQGTEFAPADAWDNLNGSGS